MGSGSGGEQLSGAEDDDPGLDSDKARIASGGLEKTLFGRPRFVVDPSRHLVVDISAGKAVETGEEAIDLGFAGVEFAIDTARTAMGGEAPPRAA